MLFFYMSLVAPSNSNKIEFIFNNYQKLMLCIAYDMLHDIEISEDMVQLSFLKLIKSIDKITIATEDANKTKNFVRTVVVNTVKDYLRQQKRKPREEFIEANDDGYEIPDNSPLPLEQLTNNEGYEKLIGYISELKDTYKDVCRLKFIHGCTEKEIADLLNLPLKTINIRIFRARQILKSRVMESEYEKNYE